MQIVSHFEFLPLDFLPAEWKHVPCLSRRCGVAPHAASPQRIQIIVQPGAKRHPAPPTALAARDRLVELCHTPRLRFSFHAFSVWSSGCESSEPPEAVHSVESLFIVISPLENEPTLALP